MSMPQTDESPVPMDTSSESMEESSGSNGESPEPGQGDSGVRDVEWVLPEEERERQDFKEQNMMDTMKWRGHSFWVYHQIKEDGQPIFRYAAWAKRGAINVRGGGGEEDPGRYHLALTEHPEMPLSNTLFQVYQNIIMKRRVKLRWVSLCNISNEQERMSLQVQLTGRYNKFGEIPGVMKPGSPGWDAFVLSNSFVRSVQALVRMLSTPEETASIRRVMLTERGVEGNDDLAMVIRIEYPGDPASDSEEDSAGSSDGIAMGDEWYTGKEELLKKQ
ncbi:hypothetical protein LQW54_012983 [Pestalotiopsis sp. IQ-011]